MMKADPNSTAPKPSPQGREHVEAVQCRNLWMRFGTSYALVGVTLRFHRAKPTVVRGPNASGKSTLLSLVAGLLRPSQGEVLFLDSQKRHLPRFLVRPKLSYFGQGAVVYQDMSAMDNLLFHAGVCGLASPTDRCRRLLDIMGVDWKDPKPCGQMSHGQMRRVGLARALLTDPEILLLDEPDAGLDRAARIHLADILMRRSSKSVLVVASHDELLCSHMDAQTIELDHGRVSSQGEPFGGTP